jgi:3-isopropylmalate dehydratase small subunit
MELSIDGRARRFGDHVNTDYIISSTRKRETLDVSVLKQFLFESVDPAFAASVRPHDLIVAGRNFGCGSAMEIAATVMLGAGIRAVLAESFSRTFYRNAINNGLLPVQCDTKGVSEGDRLAVRVTGATAAVANLTTSRAVAGAPLSGIMLEILDAGGLVPYLRAHGRFHT